DLRQVLDHFNQGKALMVPELASDAEALKALKGVRGLVEAARSGRFEGESNGDLIVACELVLEGLHAQKKLARNETRGSASYTQAKPERPSRGAYFDDWTGGKVN